MRGCVAFDAPRVLGSAATSDIRLMPSGEALPVSRTNLLHAAAQHGVASINLFIKFRTGIAVADVDAMLLLAG